MMEKFERIKLLKSKGFNVPEYTKFDAVNINTIATWLRVEPGDEFSIRTQLPQDLTVLKVDWKEAIKELPGILDRATGIPHYPFVKGIANNFRIIDLLARLGFIVIVCPGINPKDSIYAGAAYIKKGHIVVELAKNAMVRRVTHDGHIDVRFELPLKDCTSSMMIEPWIFQQIASELKRLQKYKELPLPIIVELSFYSAPVGVWKEQLIFWDFMPADEYDGYDKLKTVLEKKKPCQI